MKYSALALFASILFSCSDAPPKSPVPRPPPKPTSTGELTVPFTFALYGDCRSGHITHRNICASLLKTEAKFVLAAGDLVRDGNEEEQWELFREVTRELRGAIPYHPAKGNHDLGNKGYFEREFGLDKSYYTLRKGPIEFFMIDSNLLSENDPQFAWLDQQLARSTATHKIAVLHNPLFSLVGDRQRITALFRRKLHDRFVKAGLCAVLSGHDHQFYTTVRDGVRYVVSGGAGAHLFDVQMEFAQEGDLYGKLKHFVLIDVEEKKMSADVYTQNGHRMPKLHFPLCDHP